MIAMIAIVAPLVLTAAGAAGAAPAAPTAVVAPGAPADADSNRLTLHEAVRRALVQYPSVGAARAGREAAAAGIGEARAGLFPRVTGSLSWNRYEYPTLVYPLHGLGLADVLVHPPIFDRDVEQGALSLGYTLWDFGARGARIRSARAQEGKATAALAAAEANLIAQVAETYLGILTTRGVRDAQQQNVAALQAEADRIGQVEAQGKAARVEVLRVAAELSRARADLVATEAQLAVGEHELARLAGVSPEATRSARLRELAIADTVVASRDSLVARAEAASPDVRQARRAADAARASASVARAAWFPELRLSAAYLDYATSWQDFRPEWNAAVQLSYPLFTGFGRLNTARRSDAEARSAAEQARLAELAAQQGVDAALAQWSAAHATVVALQTAVSQSAEVERIRRLTLEVGSGTETDYLDAEAKLLQNRASLVQARHAEIAARIELARLCGQLSADWLAGALASAP